MYCTGQGVRGGHSEEASSRRRKTCLELSRDTERFSPAGRFPEEGSPVSLPGQRTLVSPWDRRASSSALCGNCQEEMLVLCHRNSLLPHFAAPTPVVPTGTACTYTVKESLAPPRTLATWTYWKQVGSLCTECNSAQGSNSDTSDTFQGRKAYRPLADPSQCEYAREVMFLDSSDLHSTHLACSPGSCLMRKGYCLIPHPG